ncbi:site-specific integrase [Mycobacterium sp. 1274761.0]|uniref:tyrosine-type recombinase/integrase n=1 Tax=Mycobacterium sp. 1274761.0 TaxID=1834077 RepID=UPI000802520E|nr:site-specific integrase [Mycobacterium sp. 1274761.0]OBK72894.1 integrase [Mycobacterium sp. 1274761.0]
MAEKKRTRRSWGKVRRLASGRWQASYIGPDLQRHVGPHSYTAKIDAEAWLIDERRVIERGEWTPPRQRAAAKTAEVVTVGQYAKQWIAHRNLKPRTRMGYEASLANHIEPVLGAIPVKSLTPQAVRAWHAGMDKKTPTARAHAYQLLHAAIATAVSDGLLPANPCNVPKALSAKVKRQAVILTPAQVAALADAMQPKRLRAMVLVMAWCAPRWGEAIELRRRDVSTDCSVITIARGATHRNGECHVDMPKSGEGRKVVVPPHIRADLRQHLDQHVPKHPDAQLFPAAMGGCHLNDRVFRDYFVEAQEAIGVSGARIHDLRHFAGTQAARVGNLPEVMDRLGHSTARASLIYQSMVDTRAAEVAEALSLLAGAVDSPQ